MSDPRVVPATASLGRRLGSKWDVLAFVVGLIVLSFVGGMLVAHYRVFPYPYSARPTRRSGTGANWRHYLRLRSR